MSSDEKALELEVDEKLLGVIARSRQWGAAEERQRILGLPCMEEEKHKEFECNGAHGGKGCYETWCEDQECRNFKEGRARNDLRRELKEEINI